MTTARDILSYPYWPRDKTQDPALIPGGILRRELEDLGINREPGRTDYNNTYFPLFMRPAVKQDTSQMGTAADHPTYGVTNPGGLYAALLNSTAAPTADKKGENNGS